ncbi:hypothetical protein AOXY_G27525 [Acipenser oxyrinchus oxyrinchus]|uniref:Secreted protein n=1 Tax=Acipenser oxyrinchus oxyrinchus TaxID=40147 RepID=A0AAD8CP02_ACIOX|nr:hypothetical protein AOXY_G27525 [Acipenser oxyrinchus oxyrinchus]
MGMHRALGCVIVLCALGSCPSSGEENGIFNPLNGDEPQLSENSLDWAERVERGLCACVGKGSEREIGMVGQDCNCSRSRSRSRANKPGRGSKRLQQKALSRKLEKQQPQRDSDNRKAAPRNRNPHKRKPQISTPL